ncbi:MAG: hypothetical protein WCV93_04945 [Candidatus Shapirobacteria bacterium]|jgi:hypothetical protein
MAIKKQASLLPDSENVNSFTSKAVHWLTTVGRVIIIFTELIVISAFVSRFWLDRKNSDISEVLRQQKAILRTTTEFETQFNSLQQRLDYISQNYKNQPNYSQLVSSIIESTPPTITFKNITVSNQDLKNSKITASASLVSLDEQSIINLINNLTLNPKIDSVAVNSIQKKTKENNYRIEISLAFKSAQK